MIVELLILRYHEFFSYIKPLFTLNIYWDREKTSKTFYNDTGETFHSQSHVVISYAHSQSHVVIELLFKEI